MVLTECIDDSAEALYDNSEVGDVLNISASQTKRVSDSKIISFQREVLNVSELIKQNKVNVIEQKSQWHKGFPFPVSLTFVKLR